MTAATKTDRQLAEALLAAEVAQDMDALIYAENEIAARLDLDPDETEQGFTLVAQDAVTAFVREHLPEEATR